MTAPLTEIPAAQLAARKYPRPQALIFADYASKVIEKLHGKDVRTWSPHGTRNVDWLVLSDHNRSGLDFDYERIENRRRMIDATMRSYWVADKRSLSVSWSELPSRSYGPTEINDDIKLVMPAGCLYTVDGGAGGSELQYWYDTHQGPFYVLMSYDDYKSVDAEDETTRMLVKQRYTHAKLMYFSSFSTATEKRTQSIVTKLEGGEKSSYVLEYDTWNVSLSLEEA